MSEDPRPTNSIGAELLRQELSEESKYKEYRMTLELALCRAERFERITFHVCWVSLLTSFGLMFVGGSAVVGSFDPGDASANVLSITLAVIYWMATIAWPISLASMYSRFRPRIYNLKRQISDAKIDKLQSEVEQLRNQIRR